MYGAIAVVIQVALTLPILLGPFKPYSIDPPDASQTAFYSDYAAKTLSGLVPFRDFLVEYPPSSVPLFVLPGLFAGSPHGYRVAFAVEMFLFQAWTILVLALRVGRAEGPAQVRARLGWYTIWSLILIPIL